MAVSVVAIIGKVIMPNGSGMPGGTIDVVLDRPFSAADGSVSQVIGGSFQVVVATDGTVSFNIVPNSGTGTSYTATFRTPDGTTWSDVWGSISASPSTQEIGDL